MCLVSSDSHKGKSDVGGVKITFIVLGNDDSKIMPESCQIAPKCFLPESDSILCCCMPTVPVVSKANIVSYFFFFLFFFFCLSVAVGHSTGSAQNADL